MKYFTYLFLSLSINAYATAPRVTAKLFGEEKKVEIIAYQGVTNQGVDTSVEKNEGTLEVAIVTEAFSAASKVPNIDILPSRQLALHTIFNEEKALALVGTIKDLPAKEEKKYSIVTFYLRAKDEEPAVIIFGKKQGQELQKAFNKGMQSIIKNGKLVALIRRNRSNLPADYIERLTKRNPSWK